MFDKRCALGLRRNGRATQWHPNRKVAELMPATSTWRISSISQGHSKITKKIKLMMTLIKRINNSLKWASASYSSQFLKKIILTKSSLTWQVATSIPQLRLHIGVLPKVARDRAYHLVKVQKISKLQLYHAVRSSSRRKNRRSKLSTTDLARRTFRKYHLLHRPRSLIKK